MVEREAQSLSFRPESPIGVERGGTESRRAWRRGSLHTGKQHVNAGKLQAWQLGIGFRPIDGDGVSVFQMDGADRDHDPQRNG
jgi:hypothetical protein